jgi:hypothetical protein
MAKAPTKIVETPTLTIKALQDNRQMLLRTPGGKNSKREDFKLNDKKTLELNLIKHYFVLNDKGEFVKEGDKPKIKPNWIEQFEVV